MGAQPRPAVLAQLTQALCQPTLHGRGGVLAGAASPRAAPMPMLLPVHHPVATAATVTPWRSGMRRLSLAAAGTAVGPLSTFATVGVLDPLDPLGAHGTPGVGVRRSNR